MIIIVFLKGKNQTILNKKLLLQNILLRRIVSIRNNYFFINQNSVIDRNYFFLPFYQRKKIVKTKF